MSTQNSKKRKSDHKNIITKNEHAEDQKSDVLVVPPDFLQKMGIHIKLHQHNIEINPGTSTKSNEFPKTEASEFYTENKYIQNDEKESSILETANLMKASVFLSPTFSSLKENISLDKDCNSSEICIEEIISKSTDIVESYNQNEHCNNKDELADEMKNDNRPMNGNKEIIYGNEMQVNSIMPDYQNIDEQTSTKSLEEKTTNKEDILEFDHIKDLMLPATLISIHNKTNESNESTSLNIEDQSKKFLDEDNFSTKKKQLNVTIREEKYHSISSLEEYSSKLNEICTTSKVSNVNNEVIKIVKEKLDSDKCSAQDENVESSTGLENKLKSKRPVVEAKFSENSSKHNPKIQTNSKKIHGDLYLPTASKFINEIQNKPDSSIGNEENNSYNSYDTKQIGYKNNNLDEVRMTNDIEADSSIFSQNSLSISHQSVDNVDNKSSESKIPLSKVEEIAFYLNQHRQNSKTKDINTIQTTRNSKLCIQGVEKPGGDMKSSRLNRNIRTYSRRKNLKFSNNTSGLILYSEYKVEKVENIDYKINDRIFRETETGTKSLHNFCLCDDFGSFFNYDVNNNYGHIHFWERKEPQCSIEILLSIYEENNLNDSYEGNRLSILEIDNEKQQELSDDSAMNICWNYGGNILEKKNHECSNSPQKLRNINEVEFVVNENEQCEKVKTQLYEGKRKRVIKTSESDSESDKPIAKKATIAVKCGVCNIEVSKYEWNNHISKAHCFIAWQEGQEIDLENEDLLIKLNERICDTEKLICTFCELEVYDVKKFIQHVQKCKKAKYGGKPNDMTEYSEIVTDVPLALESEKEQISKESAVDIKSEKKQIAQIRKGQKLEIKQNSKEEKLVEVSVLQIVTDEQQETEPHLLQLVEMEQQQEVEVPILQIVEIVEDNEGEVPVLQVETGQVAEVNVLPKETGQKSVNQKQVPEILASQVKIEPKPYCKGEKKVTCGVCKTIVCNSLWMEHITQEHNYIAWKDDETPLNCENEEDIRHYLNNIIKKIGELVCKICGLKRKFAKSYLKHIKNCQITEQSDDQESVQAATPVAIKTEKIDTENIRKFRKNTTRKVDTESIEEVNIKNINNVVKDKTRTSYAEHIEIEATENIIVKCGVCKLDISNAQWLEHICKEHDYMAWQEGEPEIDVNDSQQVHDHLFHLTKQNNGLTCKKCGLTRRYVKSYLNHITTCEGETDTVNSTLGSENVSILQANTIDTLIMDLSDTAEAKCGVCKLDVGENQWFNHAHKCHAYLAWKEGKPALDVDNEQEVQEYLYFVNKRFNGLICNKCGLTRKYVKVYLSHLESCESMLLDPSTLGAGSSNRDTYVCAVCSEEVDPKEWTNHAMNMHYNIAWAVGDYPVDLKNAGVIEKLLKAYQKQIGSFKCRICGIKRVSPMGFYVHIIQCGKTEEEIDKFRIFCELCNTKYLCFHKSQHAIMHRDQDLSKERKFKKEEKQENECLDVPKTEPFSERRRAAQKALKFIEKSETFAYNCSKCGYGADDEAELAEHDCAKVNYKDYSESEDSAQIESSGDESPESAVDSDLSAEERPASPERKRKSRGDTTSTKIPKKIPFAVKCANSYLKQSAEDYRNTFLTNGTLYPQWRSCNIDLVADDQMASYLPTLKESCKVIIGRSDPVTYNLFEAKKYNGYSVFVGGCIQCISWAPPHVCDGSDALGHFLAVACHNDVDAPRLDHDRTYEHSGLLQIWDFGDLSSSYPEFALGIAHDYGTVWAIDWCPSGARDVPALQEDNELESTLDAFPRLGLLAIACSNGSAYILSVPYPSYVKKSDKNVYKLTPVAELRLSRGKTDLCQATSINWSQQNGHGTIVVGYSSGTVALYNLECDSPLLMENEGGVQIFYPFLDERPHSSCITDVKTFPSSEGAGLRSSVSPTGCEAAQLRGAARIHKHLSSDSCAFVPHWPALMLSGNELIVNQAVNELDLWGVGRRTGAVQKCCGCVVCGHVAAFTPPVVKLVTPHPAHADLNKEPIAVFQMRPLSRKRPKRKNDELQVVLEPRTYPDAVKLYALDFKLVTDLDRESAKQILKPREQYPERFPLSDIPSMAFYPSKKHHRKLAIATHAGVIFIINVDIAR